jgi:ketosteroid isomerase-like protein
VKESSSWKHDASEVQFLGKAAQAATELLKRAYTAFNARDLEEALTTMSPDVVWPNGMEGGVVHGHDGVRAYWTRQWGMINPRVDPVDFKQDESGLIAVSVHQVVRDLSGGVLLDRMVEHVYTLKDGLIQSMDIRE